MTLQRTSISSRAEELRRAFDLSFAEAPPTTIARSENMLSVRLGGTAYVLPVSEISGVFADVKITPVPSSLPELLGIAALRGSIVPVYDLRALLGYVVGTRPRWLAVAAAAPLGLAFDELQGQRRVPRETVVQGGAVAKLRHVAGIAQLEGVSRPIVSVPAVVNEIQTRLRVGISAKE